MEHRFKWPTEVQVHPERFEEPFKTKKPGRVFVCSMSDFFHEEASDLDRCNILELALNRAPWHTYMLLTKRAEAMRRFFQFHPAYTSRLWLGITAENQDRFDERYRYLRPIPAALRFISFEPLLGPITARPKAESVREMLDMTVSGDGAKPLMLEGIDWAIVGAETGPGARPCDPAWVQSLIDQCRAADVPIFVKGRLAERFPIQEYPR